LLAGVKGKSRDYFIDIIQDGSSLKHSLDQFIV
jgi:hypothetical protein